MKKKTRRNKRKPEPGSITWALNEYFSGRGVSITKASRMWNKELAKVDKAIFG